MKQSWFRQHVSLILLFAPPVLFVALWCFFGNSRLHASSFLIVPWQFVLMAVSGVVATIGGLLDWLYHRNPLNMKLPKKERDAEAVALGLGGLPMFCLMWAAMVNGNAKLFLIPILVVLIYTVVAISYDEFVFHIKRCTKTENIYHRMLVFGNGIAWLSWFHFIYC